MSAKLFGGNLSSNTASSYGSATGRGTRQRPPPPLPLEQQTPSAPRPHLHTENISGQRGPITSVFALEDFAGDEQVSAAPIVEGRTKITGPIIEQSHSWFCGKTEELQQEVSVLETQLAELEQNNLRSPVLLQKLSRVPKVFAQKLFEVMLGACEKHKVQQNLVSPATIGVG